MSKNCNCHGSANGKYVQTVTGVLERPIYAPGLVLHDSDLTAAVDYTQSLNRMLFKHLFGCGVICGLEVKANEHCGLKIEISPGLALDGCGDAVHLAKPVSFTFDERESDKMKKDKKTFWVVLCGKEKLCAPRALVCDADDFDSVTQMTRARAMAEVSLVFEKPDCICEWQDVKERRIGQPSAVAGHPGVVDRKCFEPYPFDCADDCGCGSACNCGCCVLLGQIGFDADGKPVATHLKVRRIAKPELMQDSARCPATSVEAPAPPPPPPPNKTPVEPPAKPPVLSDEQTKLFDRLWVEAQQMAKANTAKEEQRKLYLDALRAALMAALSQGADANKAMATLKDVPVPNE
jgi:hypothetical protein